MKKKEDLNIFMSDLMLLYYRDYEKFLKVTKTLLSLALLSIFIEQIKKGEL